MQDTSTLNLVDVSIVGAMAPPGGGRNEITPRMLRHFNVISIHAFNDETMKTIFQPMIDWHFNRCQRLNFPDCLRLILLSETTYLSGTLNYRKNICLFQAKQLSFSADSTTLYADSGGLSFGRPRTYTLRLSRNSYRLLPNPITFSTCATMPE